MKRTFLTLLSFCFVLISYGQGLPKYMTESEKQMLPYYNPPQFKSSVPIGSEIRNMAEWEEQEYLTLTWTSYTSILAEIVRNARLETKVLIVCSDSNTVSTYLTNQNIPLSNIAYIESSYNTIWSRDYGPNTVYLAGDDSMAIVDWIYNRPRPFDDQIPFKISNFMSVPFYSMSSGPTDLVHTGGNFMSDGFGTAFSSNLVLSENGSGGTFNQTVKTTQEVKDLMDAHMGIDNYALMTVLPYDGIHHIDMHMKLLDEETLLIGEYPAGTLDGPQIEANLQYVLSNFTTKWGTPFKVIRIPMPPNTSSGGYSQWSPYMTYANSIFVNSTVLIPTYYEEFDTVAQRIYERALPGYNIVGIPCNSIIPSGGALHCITHEIGIADPLLISYKKIQDTIPVNGNPTVNFSVDAMIRHRSGIGSATIYYSTDTAQGFTSLSMGLTNAANHTYSASFSLPNTSGKVYYYIDASSVSGKSISRPMPGPSGPNSFKIMASIGTEERRLESIEVYPNPCTAITCIELESGFKNELDIALFDLQGKLVENIHSGFVPFGTSHFFFNAETLNNGTYLLRISGESEMRTKRIVVQH